MAAPPLAEQERCKARCLPSRSAARLVALLTNHLAALLLGNDDLTCVPLIFFSVNKTLTKPDQTRHRHDDTHPLQSLGERSLGREEPREDLNTSKQGAAASPAKSQVGCMKNISGSNISEKSERSEKSDHKERLL